MNKDHALFRACSDGEVEKIKMALSQGADIGYTVKKDFKITCLQAAARSGRAAAVEFLLTLPTVDPKAVNQMWTTALMFTIECQPPTKIKAADVGFDHFHCLKLLIPVSHLEAQDRMGYTALLWAALKGDPHMCAELIQAGADWTATDNQGTGALGGAAKKGHLACLQFLWPYFQSEDQKPAVEQALELALHYGRTACAQYLQAAQEAQSDANNIAHALPVLGTAKSRHGM